MIFGLDLLGLGSRYWDVRQTIKEFPQGFALGVFAKVFGDAMPNVKKLLASGKVGAFRLQAEYNGAHKLPSEQFLRRELPRWNALAVANPGIPFYVSPSCEYVESSASKVERVMSLAEKLCPNCIIVQTPGRLPNGKMSPTLPRYLVEQHGNRARTGCDLVSTDGENCFDMCDEGNPAKGIESWIARHSQASRIIFLHAARFNLREGYKPPQMNPPPNLRKAAPPPGYVKGVARLAMPKGPVPTPVFQAEALKKPRLWKTFAEDSPGEADPRGNRPVYMEPKKVARVDIVTFDNKLVKSLPLYPDAKPHSIERYYSSDRFAYQIGAKALELSGSEWVWFKVGSKYYGPVCAPFRAPFFQVPK